MEVIEMKTQGRIKRILGHLLILAMVIAMVPAMPGEAASKKSKAISAYKKMLSKNTVTVIPKKIRFGRFLRTREPAKSKNVMFAIAYIDNDSVPELILLDSATEFCGIWTFRNGKVENVDIIQAAYDIPKGYGTKVTGYYKRKGIFQEVSVFPGGYNKSFSKISNGTAEEVLFAVKDRGDTAEQYYYNGSDGASKKISKGKFNKKLKSYIGSTKLTKTVMRKNTESNRKKYLK